MLKYFTFFYLLMAGFAGAASYPVMLGNTKVTIIKQVRGKGKTLVHLHENEKTAALSAKKYLRRYGGTLISLKHSGQRNIVFHLSGRRYEFDPNRIFTEQGIKETLKLNGRYSRRAHGKVRAFAAKIKRLLPKTGKIIVVHNNKEYSLKDYLPGHSLANDAKALYYVRNSSYRNFYFVTQPREYQRLKKLRFNVVLQQRCAKNDGSLSIYLAKRNYINIEAAFGEINMQMKMLQYA